MPKKKKNNKQKLDEDELASMLKPLLEKKSKEKKNGPKKNSLDAGNMDFHTFMQTPEISESKSSVLEKITAQQERPVFVPMSSRKQGAAANNSEEDSVRYVPTRESNEPKYADSGYAETYEAPEKIDADNVGRQQPGELSRIKRDVDFIQHGPREEPRVNERTWKVDRIDVEQAGREDTFKPAGEKYEKYKPKLPK